METHTAAHRAFCADLNQKLRAPLNAILGYAELLALQTDDRRDNADVQQITRSARELLSIIERELGEGETKPPPAERIVPMPISTCDLLYVEDDIVNFTLVERILEYRPRVNLHHAQTGQLGLEMAEAEQPRLILLDLNLPDMHGSEVLRMLQANTATADIPVVVLSANATPSAIERLLSAGAKNYITKPFDIDPFLAVIDEFTAA
ncbi:MAG TPA: response regulator [Chthoniobacterales bacterium]|nr:response regulator [Chthoniobacterales bacterium]